MFYIPKKQNKCPFFYWLYNCMKVLALLGKAYLHDLSQIYLSFSILLSDFLHFSHSGELLFPAFAFFNCWDIFIFCPLHKLSFPLLSPLLFLSAFKSHLGGMLTFSLNRCQKEISFDPSAQVPEGISLSINVYISFLPIFYGIFLSQPHWKLTAEFILFPFSSSFSQMPRMAISIWKEKDKH